MRTNLTIDYDVTPAEQRAAHAVLVPTGGMPTEPARRIKTGGATAMLDSIVAAIGGRLWRRKPNETES